MKEINPPVAPDAAVTTALVGGRLIDGRGGAPVEDAVVIVRGAKILAADSRTDVMIPDLAQTVDITGMSILPGLIDSHFHSRNDVQTPVEYELQNGITSFRDPWHPFRFYNAVLQSDRAMPRVFLCGAHLDAHPPVWADQAVVIKDAHHARRTVNGHVDRGASAIKVYFRLPLVHIKETCAAAKERGVLVTAHLELVDADDAIRAGIRGIEHVTSFGTALAAAEEAAQFKSAIFADSNARRELRHRLWARLDLHASPRVKRLLKTIVDHDVFVSPTLAIFERRAGKKNATEVQVRGFANMMRFAGQCHEAGAKVVVGSHTSALFAEPGRAYQRELELLVEAGLTPLQAITAATLHNAQFFGIQDRLGTIEAGKTADLILVDGDPSRDVAAMRNVKQVMLNGIWIGVSPQPILGRADGLFYLGSWLQLNSPR
jgi:imidazolonepropionase-like amidohydrolase